ncbi:MAG: aldo/keto reductase [Candidatus Omnitrophica bacterium]|nr:aldo/keto reductase [Candidatus Omnitrophota bacterium]
MKYHEIPKTSLKTSGVCLGTWVFSGDVWGPTDEKECIDTVRAALDSGINFIDTAPIYGFGRAEEIVGKAIKGQRKKFVLATKCGFEWKEKRISHNLKPERILKEIDDSLKRLQTDYIDLYQIHWPDVHTPLEETLKTLCEIKAAGKIKYIGVSNFDEELLKQACEYAEIVTLQNQYSLLKRSIEEKVLPLCLKENVGVLTYGSLGGGILSGKYKKQPHPSKSDVRNFFYHYYSMDQFPKVHAFVESLKALKRPLNQVAINWVRQQKGVASVIVGCRTVDQLKGNAEALTWKLTSHELRYIDDILEKFSHA